MLGVLGSIFADGSLLSNAPLLALAGLSTVVAGALVMGILGSKRPPGFPPGPSPVPFVGNVSDIRKEGQPLWVTMGDLAKEYGDVFSVKLGDKWYVVLNSYEAIKEGLVSDPAALSNRPHYYSTDLFSEDYRDIAYTNNTPVWQLHREFAKGTFREMSSTAHLDSVVEQHFKRYVVPRLTPATADETSVDAIALGQAMAMQLLVSWCFGVDNEELHESLGKAVAEDVSLNLVGRRMAVDIFPVLKHLPLASTREVRDVVDRFMDLLQVEFRRRREKFNEGDKATDLCEALIHAQRAAEKEAKLAFLTDVHVIQVLASSFRGSLGFLTTTYWVLAVLAEFPDVQERITKEIRDVVGSERAPSLTDRDLLPYTQAAVTESLRFGAVASLGVPRAAHADVTINGFDIPKGTVVLYNIYGTHFNEQNFENPQEFNPGRFLGPDGALLPSPKVIAFGLGIRKCLGYSQAESFLFLNLCHLLRDHRVAKTSAGAAAAPDGQGSLLVQDPKYEGSRWPAPFHVTVTKRD